MSSDPASPAALVCELVAPDRPRLSALAAIATVCARDVGLPLAFRRLRSGPPHAPALVTLHLPAAWAATQHPVWCLACRLACFCPEARVSVLVGCGTAFEPPARPRRRAAA